MNIFEKPRGEIRLPPATSPLPPAAVRSPLPRLHHATNTIRYILRCVISDVRLRRTSQSFSFKRRPTDRETNNGTGWWDSLHRSCAHRCLTSCPVIDVTSTRELAENTTAGRRSRVRFRVGRPKIVRTFTCPCPYDIFRSDSLFLNRFVHSHRIARRPQQ